jgi:LPXTG-motif cell wall-anchored protein
LSATGYDLPVLWFGLAALLLIGGAWIGFARRRRAE